MTSLAGRRVMSVFVVLSCLTVIGSFSGCTKKPSRPKTYPVRGTVTFNGAPVEGATVTFIPKEGVTGEPKPQAASGITDSSGRYTIGTFATGDGAIPGEYLVKVTKYRSAQRQQPAETNPENEMQAFFQYEQGAKQQTRPKSELPAKYENEKTSGLFFQVQPGDNTFDIDLKP
ncbi:MAG: carboxypeptidase-like regulatory domain-containing protein [Thermogutta sp.]